MISQKPGSDPAAVVYDTINAALARGCDTVIADTAGRMHTKVNLMEEMKKEQTAKKKKWPPAQRAAMPAPKVSRRETAQKNPATQAGSRCAIGLSVRLEATCRESKQPQARQ